MFFLNNKKGGRRWLTVAAIEYMQLNHDLISHSQQNFVRWSEVRCKRANRNCCQQIGGAGYRTMQTKPGQAKAFVRDGLCFSLKALVAKAHIFSANCTKESTWSCKGCSFYLLRAYHLEPCANKNLFRCNWYCIRYWIFSCIVAVKY